MEHKICFGCMNTVDIFQNKCPYCGFDISHYDAPEYVLRPGTLLAGGRYLVGKMLGKGGFGITYIGIDRMLRLRVAIKEYYPEGYVGRDVRMSNCLYWYSVKEDAGYIKNGRDILLKEARNMARLDNLTTLARVKDVFLENETAYLVMDYIEGLTLKEFVRKRGVLSYQEIVFFLKPVMTTMAEVHRYGIIHRDISPDNIMIQPDGRSRILDLGAAKNLNYVSSRRENSVSLSHSTIMIQRKGFSPMEQYMSNGKIGSWTDVYALSATIYYLMSGKLLLTPTDRLVDSENERKVDAIINSLSMPAIAKQGLKKGIIVRSEDRLQTMNELAAYFIEEKKGENEESQKIEEARREEERRKIEEAQKKEEKRNVGETLRKEENRKVEENPKGKDNSGQNKIKYAIVAAVLLIALVIVFHYFNKDKGNESDTDNTSSSTELVTEKESEVKQTEVTETIIDTSDVEKDFVDMKDYTDQTISAYGGTLENQLAAALNSTVADLDTDEGSRVICDGNIIFREPDSGPGFFVMYNDYVSGFSIFGIYPGMKTSKADGILKEQGMSLKDNNYYYTKNADYYISVYDSNGVVEQVQFVNTTSSASDSESYSSVESSSSSESGSSSSSASDNSYKIDDGLDIHISDGITHFETRYFDLYMPNQDDIAWDYKINGDRTVSFYYDDRKNTEYDGWVGSLCAYDERDESYKEMPSYKIAGISADESITYIYVLPTDVRFASEDEDGYQKLREYMDKIDIDNDQNPLYLNGVERTENSSSDSDSDSENESSSDYIFPDSDCTYLTKSDVSSLSEDEVQMAINEIYARHGRIFTDKKIKKYFESKSWYHGTVDPDDFQESVFNVYEKANIELLKKYR